MSRSTLASILGMCLVAWSCAQKAAETPVPMDTASAEISRLREQLAEKEREATAERAYIEEATKTINDVQDGLLAIAPVERTARVTASEQAMVSPMQRERMLAAIFSAKAELEAKTQRIAEFQQKNAQFDHKVAGLEQTISSLQVVVKAKAKEIAELQKALEQSQRKVTELTAERTEDKQQIEKASAQIEDIELELKTTRQEMNLGFYVIAKADDLVRQHVLTRSGGIVRKKRYALTGSVAHMKFDTLDITEVSTIPITSADRNRYLFPPREADTYHWSQDGPKQVLVIDDVKMFWQYRYLIIAVE